MKIILCIFLLYITAVSVFGQSVELNGIVGQSVKFPAAVKIDGSLRYSGVPIGDVTSARFTAARNVKFSGRLHWDSSTGLFSLSGLEMEDSGEYTVHNTQQNINTVFQLNVYKDNVPVLKPHLSFTRNEYPCTILCAAERGTGATLTLYKNGETKPYITSPVRSHPHLDMTQTVESGKYTCEAKNSVSRETSDPLTVEAHCTAGPSAGTIVGIILAVVAVVVTVFTAGFFAYKYRRTRRELEGTRRELEGIRKEHAGIRKEHASIRKEHASTRSELEGIRKEHASTRSELEDVQSSFIKLIHGLASQDTKSELKDKHKQASSQDVIHGLASQDTKSELKAVQSSFIELIHGRAKCTDVPNKED